MYTLLDAKFGISLNIYFLLTLNIQTSDTKSTY